MAIIPSAVLELGAELVGNYFVSLSRSFDSNWVLLGSDKQFWSGPGSREPPVPPFHFQVYVYDGYVWHVPVKIGPTEKRYHFAQTLPGGKWLLVEARARVGQSANADVFDGSGQLVASWFLGDGIEHLQVSTAGDIWVGYFDEGVYGGGQLEHSGLVCFGQDGDPKLRFWQGIAEPNGLPPIDDLYALNVCRNGDAWCCYYSDFPLVRLKDLQLQEAWREFPKKPVRAFAVNGARLLMVPAYMKSGPLSICDLSTNTITEEQLTDSSGRTIAFDFVVGRDVTLGFVSLNHFENPVLYQVDFT